MGCRKNQVGVGRDGISLGSGIEFIKMKLANCHSPSVHIEYTPLISWSKALKCPFLTGLAAHGPGHAGNREEALSQGERDLPARGATQRKEPGNKRPRPRESV